MSARFSPDRLYRYTLHRNIEATQRRTLNFIGLNPSTADEYLDDATVRRCIGFARRWDYSDLIVTNVFAYRSTDPVALSIVKDPIGPDNDQWLAAMAAEAQMVVAAWSGMANQGKRYLVVTALLRQVGTPVFTLGLTKAGWPRHPLYVRADVQLQEFDLNGHPGGK